MLFPVGPLEVTSLAPNADHGRVHMRIDQLEDRSLEPHLEALQRSMPRLAGQRESKVPADRVARL